MPAVDLQRPLSVPAVPARAAISAIVHDIVDGKGVWAEFALYASLGTFGLPDVGYVAVPVRLENVSESAEPRHEIRFRMHSRRSPESFPAFDGALGIDAAGPSTASLWLAGTYEVPMKPFGIVFDRVFARGTAEKTLDNMLEELADGVVARVEQREFADTRYRLAFRTGD